MKDQCYYSKKTIAPRYWSQKIDNQRWKISVITRKKQLLHGIGHKKLIMKVYRVSCIVSMQSVSINFRWRHDIKNAHCGQNRSQVLGTRHLRSRRVEKRRGLQFFTGWQTAWRFNFRHWGWVWGFTGRALRVDCRAKILDPRSVPCPWLRNSVLTISGDRIWSESKDSTIIRWICSCPWSIGSPFSICGDCAGNIRIKIFPTFLKMPTWERKRNECIKTRWKCWMVLWGSGRWRPPVWSESSPAIAVEMILWFMTVRATRLSNTFFSDSFPITFIHCLLLFLLLTGFVNNVWKILNYFFEYFFKRFIKLLYRHFQRSFMILSSYFWNFFKINIFEVFLYLKYEGHSPIIDTPLTFWTLGDSEKFCSEQSEEGRLNW